MSKLLKINAIAGITAVLAGGGAWAAPAGPPEIVPADYVIHGVSIPVALKSPFDSGQPSVLSRVAEAPGEGSKFAGGNLDADVPQHSDGLATYKVEMNDIDDLKSVYGTVRSTDRIEARARIGGTIASLSVDEGSDVKAGEVIALVADQKLALKLKALEAQIAGLTAQRVNTNRDLGRQEELIKRGFTPKAKVDELSTQLEVVDNQLKSAEAERDVVMRQVKEGEVLAPASGRVLLVPVTVGSVIMPGESLATIAGNQYVLRLELPERHARFINKGDSVQVGRRSLDNSGQPLIKGEITQVYPELQGGRVVADASVKGLGDYFVGERVLVYISVGMRRGMVIPRSLVATRYGYDFVKVARGKARVSDVIVQLGPATVLADGSEGVEVLGGLNPGDEIVKP
ncbi:MAG TPA: efflux RND transporter periplasmic adaptor subunit [Hyphomicrobiaceae bacterium]|nr:efflux RND transporter periplasmic adaptor subunit [Hyphomicrobiaceae bacterium]